MGLLHIILSILWSLFIQFFLSCCFSSLRAGFPATATSFLGGNETDRLALLAFKADISNDPFGVMRSWNESLHFCHWPGVTCGRRHKRVTVLDLSSKQLGGFISPYIGNLSFLHKLVLDNNSFSRTIPHEVGCLFRLRALSLRKNFLTGEIPSNISRCSNLMWLDLGYNKLIRKVPMELGSLAELEALILDYNNLIECIPPSIGNLSYLHSLYATGNNFQGTIPNTLGLLAGLKNLALGENKLSGTIPSSLYNLSSLTLFYAPENQIYGSLPPNVGFTLPNLQMLSLCKNHLSGRIPDSIANASNLLRFEIYGNKFHGEVPVLAGLHKLQRLLVQKNQLGHGADDDLSFLSSLINCTKLEKLSISDNNFGGVLPPSIGNFSKKLKRMELGRNLICGSIPDGIGNLFNLEALGVESNQFSGSVPSSIGKLRKLHQLFIFGNKLSGNIPFSLGNLTQLNVLNLGSNMFQGSIPSSLGKCQNLQILKLSQNKLTGWIPKEVIGLSSLSILIDLSHNFLTGPLPSEVGYLKNLPYLDVSENDLSGEIPSTLGSCTSLETLSLNGNSFHGIIPPSLSSLRAIQSLDLSCNNLFGQISPFLGYFKLLRHLNLSYNDFEGEIPLNGVSTNTSAISVIGNKKLCGGLPELQMPRCVKPNKRSSLTMKAIILIVCGLLSLTSTLLFLIQGWLRKPKIMPSSSRSSLKGLLPKLSYEDLLKATNGFSSANLIGVGGFGSIYKGILYQDEIAVAIKVLNLQCKGASKSFIAECEALRKIKHRNLVKIITACSSVDFQGNDFKALVYKFMVNGSLEEWLHPIVRQDEEHEVPRSLNLLQRVNIAIDVACALDYLHHHCETPIVHCDLKPSNVLMDANMTACVADFGLARFLLEATHQFSPNQPSSLGINGSIGYAAPEYGMGSKASTYGDVYSYGILLLEMFTGKRPTDDMFKEGLNLHNFAKMALLERVMDIADPILISNREDNVMAPINTRDRNGARTHIIQECLISIVRIGVVCSEESPRERMDINDVAKELYTIKNTLLRTGMHA